MIWLGWVLWHINHFRLFNNKSFLYIYISNMICKHILLKTFLNEPKFILLHSVKWLQVLLCITSNSIKHQSFVYTQSNFKTVPFLTIQFSKSHLFALSLNVKQFYLIQRLFRMLPLQVRVDLGEMAMKGGSASPKSPALLEPHF